MADKKLSFKFELDQTSFNGVKRALNELLEISQKLSKTMSGVVLPGQGGGSGLMTGSLGGSGPGQGAPGRAATQSSGSTSLSKVVLENANAFRSLASVGSSSMTGLTSVLRSSIRDQIREVKTLESQLASATAAMDNLKTSGASAKKIAAAERDVARIAGSQLEAREKVSELVALRRQPGLPHDPDVMAQMAKDRLGKGPPGRFSEFLGDEKKQQKLADSITGVAMKAAMIAGGAVAAFREADSGSRMFSNIEAKRSDLVVPEIRRILSGDVSRMMARQAIMADPDRRKDYLAQVGGMSETATYAGAFLGGAMSLASGQGGGIAEGIANAQTDLAAKAFQIEADYEKSAENLPQKMAWEAFRQDLGTRVSAGGVLGLGTKYKDRGMALEGKNLTGVDTYGLKAAELMKAGGYTVPELAQAHMQSMGLGLGGRGAGEMMRAQAMGFGQWGQVIQGAQRGVAGRNLPPGVGAGLQYTALGGGINTAAGMQLGQQAFGFDPRGTTSGIGLMSAVQGGFKFTGGVGDLNTVDRIKLGVQAGDAVAGGFDAYQRGQNLVSAVGAMPGGSTYAQDYLGGKMGFKQLMDAAKGDITVTGKAMGMTAETAKKQLAGSASSIMDRWVDQGGTDPMSLAMRKYQSSGMELPDYLKSLKKQKGGKEEAQSIGAFIGMETGIGEEGGLGYAGLLGGMDLDPRKLKGGKPPARGVGVAEQAALDREAEQLKTNAKMVGDSMIQYKTSIETAVVETDKLKSFATNLSTTAEGFVTSLADLSAAINHTVQDIKSGTTTPFEAPSATAAKTSSTTKAGAKSWSDSPAWDVMGSEPL